MGKEIGEEKKNGSRLYDKIDMDTDFLIEIRDRNKKYFLGNAHSHNHYELYYLARGEINYFIGDNIYLVKKGDIILIPPHVIHKTVPCEDYKHSRILMNIKPEFLSEFLKYDPNLFDFYNAYIIPSSHRTTGRVENILQTLLGEYNDNPDLIMIKSLLGELFTILKRRADAETKEDENVYAKRDTCSDRILGIVRYINSKYQTDICLDDLSQEFYMSPTYLSRTFKKIMGTTYSDYIKSVRINHSIHLLINTSDNITQIATQTGFNSSNHFCKTFKDSMGISPLKYRQSFKSKSKKRNIRSTKSDENNKNTEG